jgi:hypothetical protein
MPSLIVAVTLLALKMFGIKAAFQFVAVLTGDGRAVLVAVHEGMMIASLPPVVFCMKGRRLTYHLPDSVESGCCTVVL